MTKCLILVPGRSWNDVVRVVDRLLDVYAHKIGIARVDAYSDFEDEMPSRVLAAQAYLRTLGAMRGCGDPGMDVIVDPGEGEGLDILRTYAPWSIHVDIEDQSGDPLIVIDDGGSSIVVHMYDENYAWLQSALKDIAEVHVKE
jgi:hypothetical protein